MNIFWMVTEESQLQEALRLLEEVNDPALLREIGKAAPLKEMRLAADDALAEYYEGLENTARYGKNLLVREQAISCIEDQELLEDLWMWAKYEEVRRAAKRRLHFLRTGEEDYSFPVEREIPGLVSEETYDNVSHFCEKGYSAVRRGDKVGFADGRGCLVVPCIYDNPLQHMEYGFVNGMASMQLNGLWGGIDGEGRTIIPFEYDDLAEFYQGLVAASKGGLYGYINREGRVVIPFRYQEALGFSEGKAVVKKDNVQWVIDETGQELFPLEGCETRYAQRYLGGRLSVGRWIEDEDEYGGRRMLYGLLDTEGRVAVPLIYDELDNFYEENVRPATRGELCGAVDSNGREVIPFEYDRIWNFCDDVVIVQKGSKYGTIDREGRWVLPLVYDNIDYPESGASTWPVKLEGMWGLVDRTGAVVLPLEYDSIGVFYRGRAAVQIDDKWGCVDTDGRLVVPIIYDEVEGFEDTPCTMVALDGKYGCVGPNNEPVFPILYEDVCWPMEEVAIVLIDCDMVVVDRQGRVVYPHPIDNYRALDGQSCWICVHGQWRMLRGNIK